MSNRISDDLFTVGPRISSVILFGILVCASLTSKVMADEAPNINGIAFDKLKVASRALDKFTVDASGNIVDGPRRSVGEPPDYSSLLSKEFVSKFFVFSILGCIEGTRHCDPPVFRLSKKSVALSIIFTGTNLASAEPSIVQAFEETLRPAGFSLERPISDMKNVGSEPHIKVVVGDLTDLLSYASKGQDPIAIDHFAYYFGESSTQFQREKGGCYLDTRHRAAGIQEILAIPEFLEKCLPRTFLAAAGLNETSGAIPSVTSDSSGYYHATLLDIAYLDALYSDEFLLSVDWRILQAQFLNAVGTGAHLSDALTESD